MSENYFVFEEDIESGQRSLHVEGERNYIVKIAGQVIRGEITPSLMEFIEGEPLNAEPIDDN